MADIEEIVCSVELPIGTKFYYWNRLYEAVEADQDKYRCLKCVFYDEFWNDPMCQIASCGKSDRHDKKSVFFKEVKKMKEKKND